MIHHNDISLVAKGYRRILHLKNSRVGIKTIKSKFIKCLALNSLRHVTMQSKNSLEFPRCHLDRAQKTPPTPLHSHTIEGLDLSDIIPQTRTPQNLRSKNAG